MGPPRWQPCGPWPVQLRLGGYTGAVYVAGECWREARLEVCPLHGGRSCGFSRHGSYPRVEPPGTRIARFRCPTARVTFSLLPDFLASRLSGTLDEVEEVVCRTEAAQTVERAADELRPDIQFPGRVRWVRRRLSAVRSLLVTLVTLMPERLPVAPNLGAVRGHLGTEHALEALRAEAQPHLAVLRSPLGFLPPPWGGGPRGGHRQHETGADPSG